MSSGQYEVVKLPSSEDQLSSYYPAPQDYSQQQSNDVEMENVVTDQPQPFVARRPLPHSDPPRVLIFSIVVISIMGGCMFLPSLCCAIPGLVLAVVAHNLAGKPKHGSTARALNSVSICCNVTGLLVFVIFLMFALSQLLANSYASYLNNRRHY